MSDLLNKASLVVIPSGYKEDTVYSVVPSDGSGDLSFTRASNGTRVNSAGLVEVCPWNLLQQSETFDNAFWSVDNGSITANSTTAPNGTATADTFTKTIGSTAYLYNGSFNLGIGQFTQSIYAKANASSSIRLEFVTSAFGNGAACIFDLSNGTAGSITIYGGVSGFTATIENVGNGWYRCSIGGTLTIADTYYYEISITTGSIFIWGAQLNIGSTAKPYFPTTDRLNVPRLTYQNGGGGCPSLLLEKQSTNLMTYSEQFDQADWTKRNSTISANATTSPDGTQNADKLQEDTATGQHDFYQYFACINGNSYSMSFYAKASERTFCVASFSSTGLPVGDVFFNLQTGVVVSAPSGITATMTSAGNGWYRCVMSAAATSTEAAYFVYGNASNGSTKNYAGTSGSGTFIWGAQVEASSYPTSYIPTTSASATRVADACFKTGISSLIGQTEGVLFVDINYISHEAQSILAIEDWTTNSTVMRILADTSTSIGAQVYVAALGGNQYVATFNSAVNGQRYKCALAYKNNDFAFYINGTQVSTASSGTVPTSLNVRFGAFISGQTMDGQINQAVLFKTRLTNAELASLTTL
jgi:hypothetical protein